MATFIVRIFFIRPVHLLKDISASRIVAAVGRSGRKVMTAAIAPPVGHRHQSVHALTGRHARRCRHVPSAHDAEIFVSTALEERHAVGGIEVVVVGKVGTLQTVTAHGSHVDHQVVVCRMLHQVVVVEEPSRTLIDAAGIFLHADTLGFHFGQKLFQFGLLGGSE